MASAGTAEIQKLHKSSVRAVLLSQIGGVLLRNFTSDYKNLLNEPVPYSQYGFKDLESFLRALPDIVRFEYSNTNQDWRLFGIGDPSTFMSGHAKKAQGKPGQDKDPVDGANKRVRKGRGQRNKRIKLPQSPPHQATRHAPNRPPQQNGQCGYEDLTPDLRGFYALCCPIRQKHMKETILNELRTIAEVKDVRDSNGLLFTRYISKADAIKVLETFKAKYDMRIAKQRVSQAYPPPGRAKVNQTRSRNGEVGTSQASPFSVGGGTSSVSPFSNGWGTAGPFATGGVTSQTNPAIQDKTKGILDQYSGPGVEIYIGNIPKTLTQSHVLHLLSNITVKDLRIKGKENKWYAFGLIATPEEAALAVNRLNGHFFGGRRLICRLSKPDPAKTKPEANHAGPRNSSQDNFTPDPEALEALLFIEVPRDQAIAALKANNNNLQDASLWLVSNTEDLLTALKDMEATPKKTENRCAAFFPDPANLDELMVNGIEREHAIKALKVSNNNLEEAADWIMAHMAELGITTSQNNMESTQPINVPVETQPRNASEEVPPMKTPGEALPMKTPGKAPPINTPGEARPVEKEATFSPNPQHLEELLGYGIERETAIEALRVSKNDLDGAADWIIARTHLSGEEIQGKNLTVSTTLVVSANEVSRQVEQHTGLVTSTESVTASPIQPLGVGVSLEPQSSVDREVPKSLQMAPVPLPREEAPVDLPPPLQEAVDDPSLPPLADDLPPPLEEDDDLPPPLEDDDDDSIPDLEHDDGDDDLTDRSTDSQSIITVGSASERVSIFVGRFPVDTKQIDLLELFSPYNPLKIKMINNFDPLRKTFAFVVLPSTELAEQAIEEMDRYQYRGKCLQVGRAFVKYGYTETPSDEEESQEPEAAPEDPLLAAVPESVSFHHILMTEVWPNAKILHTDLLGRLPVIVTAIVDEQFFFGQVLKFVQEQAALGLINEELDSVCKARPPEKRVPVHRCAAIYDGNWYRAYNMGELDNNKHAVMFLDYGNIERLDAKDLRRPELDMWNDPPIAKPFKLTKGSLSGYGVTEGIEVNVVASNDGTPCLASVTRVEMSRQSNY